MTDFDGHLVQVDRSAQIDQFQAVVTREAVAQQMQDDLRVLGVVLVPAVVERLARAGERQGGDQPDREAGLQKAPGEGTMVVAGGLESAGDRLAEAGLLVDDGQGRLRCVCPALAAAVSPSAARPVYAVPAHRDSAPVPITRTRAWSATEERIVALISRGRTNRQIGSELGLSEKTVESHLTRLFAKSGCRSRVALVAKANQEARRRTGAGAAFRESAA